jgi:hypothetical protein
MPAKTAPRAFGPAVLLGYVLLFAGEGMALGHAASAPARVWADYKDDDPMDNGDPQEYRGELRSADVHIPQLKCLV